MYRLRQRRISRVDFPSARRRVTYARVAGSLRILVRAIVWRALFSARSPPRLSRWRWVCPLETSRGLVPAALLRCREVGRADRCGARLDGVGEFGEGRREPVFRVGIRAEFVVAAAHVLDKGVSGADHSSRAKLLRPRIGRSRALSRP